MKNRNEILEHIDQYLLGYMDPKEAEAFRQKMKSDRELHELTENQKMANMLVIGNRLQEVKDMMDEDFRMGKVKSQPKHIYRNWIIAGTLLFLMVLGLMFFYKKDKGRDKQNNFTPAIQNKATLQNNINIESENDTRANPALQETTNHIKPASKSGGKRKNDVVPEKKMKIASILKNDSVYVQNEESLKPQKMDSAIEKVLNEKIAESKQVPSVIDSIGIIKNDQNIREENIGEVDQFKQKNSENNFSFKPEFGEVFNIPVNSENGDIVILDRAGNKVYEAKIQGNHANIWDGSTLQGGFASPNLYLYFIKYENGSKENGQVIIY